MISRRRGKLHPYRVFFWTAVVIGVTLAVLQRYPITMQASDPELVGRATPFEGRGDILVVLDDEVMQTAAREGRIDRSWA